MEIINYITVNLVNFFVLLVWPRFVFGFYLRGKKILFQIFFCIASMIVISNFCLLTLGCFNLINRLPIQIVFYSIPIVVLIYRIFKFTILKSKKNYKFDLNCFILHILTIDENISVTQYLKRENISNIICSVIIFITIVVTTLHFSKYAINHDIFGYVDMDRYYQWIRQMRTNMLFGEGVYPFGLMTHILLITSVFPIDLKIALKFTCSVANVFLLISFYWFLKVFLKRKETITSIFVVLTLIIVFLVNLEDNGKIIVYGLSRFQYTLTNEFALWSIFVSPICLFKILNTKNNVKLCLTNKYSILFTLSMTTAICVHPYILFLQFLTCLCVFFVYLNKLKIKTFFTIVIDVIISFIIGSAPLLINFVKVRKLYGSFEWGIGLISGHKGTAESVTSVPAIKSIFNSNEYSLNSIFDYFNVFYNEAVRNLFGTVLTPVVILLFTIGIIFAIYLTTKSDDTGKHYLILVLCAVLYFVIYVAPILNLWRLIEGYRLVYILYLLILSVCLLPLDYIFNKHPLNQIK